jgi:hypothetical protein
MRLVGGECANTRLIARLLRFRPRSAEACRTGIRVLEFADRQRCQVLVGGYRGVAVRELDPAARRDVCQLVVEKSAAVLPLG